MSASAALKVRKHPRRAAREIAIRRLRIEMTRAELGSWDIEREQTAIDELEQALRGADRCIRCGVALQDSDSLERGIGPDCWAREQKRARASEGSPATQGATQ